MAPFEAQNTGEQTRRRIADLEEHLAYVKNLKAQTKELAMNQSDCIGGADEMMTQQQRQIAALEDELGRLKRLVNPKAAGKVTHRSG